MYRTAIFVADAADAAANYVRYITTPTIDFHSRELWGLPEAPLSIHEAWAVKAIDLLVMDSAIMEEEVQGHLWALEVAFTPYLKQGFIRVAEGIVGFGQSAYVVLPDRFGPIWAVSALFNLGALENNTHVNLRVGYEPWKGSISV